MRKFIVSFLMIFLLTGSLSPVAYAAKDCTKDTLIDKFGDWFGNLGKPEAKKKRNIAARRASRLVECEEAKKRKAAEAL